MGEVEATERGNSWLTTKLNVIRKAEDSDYEVNSDSSREKTDGTESEWKDTMAADPEACDAPDVLKTHGPEQ